MDTQHHTLVLYFDPKHAATQQKVRACLIELFPIQTDRLEAVLKRGRVVLKRNALPEQNQHIVNLFAATGAVCRFEKTARQPYLPAPRSGEAKNSPNEMICPKCCLTQSAAAECSRCGLIINKYKNQTPLPSTPQKPATSTNAMAVAPVKPWAILKVKYGPTIDRVWAWVKGNPLGDMKLKQWSRRIADALFRCLVVSTTALILEIGMLYMAKMVWFVYISTHIGQVYLAKFGAETNGIQYLMASNLALVGWQAVMTVLVLCVMVAAVSQWFFLLRFLYLPFGFVGHTVLWTLPLTGLSAYCLYRTDLINHFGVSCMVTLLPTLLLLPACVQLAQILMPDMGIVIRATKNAAGHIFDRLHTLRSSIKNW